ncbi:hypothetical protein H1D32_05345 [Anaerobacillus sp. CMMVII]|nr:hypothetical protein [Anaerobacillus sp. CMMVII]
MIHIFLASPLVILLYLSKYPRDLKNQLQYNIWWIGLAMLFEVIAVKKQVLFFRRGWNFGWSFLLYIKMFIYSYFFKERKGLILFLSVLTTVVALKIFQVPLRRELLKGPVLLMLNKKKKKISFL